MHGESLPDDPAPVGRYPVAAQGQPGAFQLEQLSFG